MINIHKRRTAILGRKMPQGSKVKEKGSDAEFYLLYFVYLQITLFV